MASQVRKTYGRIMIPNSSEQTTFRYPFFLRWFTFVFNLLAFAMPVYLVSRLLFKTSNQNTPLLPAVLLAIFFNAVFLGVVLILTANFFPEITANKNGLQVQFLWLRLPLLWQDIIEIKPSFFNLPSRPTSWVVRTQKLTAFHRLYGLLYSFTFLPCFIIRYEIENREALIEMINKRRFEKSS
jgi:hypothetical protein